MKRFSILLLSIIISIGAIGQSKKADDIINKVSDKANSFESFKVNFTFEIDGPDMDSKESDKGILLVKGDNYILDIAGQKVICDGETIWTYLQDAAEVQINEVEEEDGAISPSNIFTFYSDNYKSKFIKEDVSDGKTIQIIELKPSIDRNYAKVELSINKAETMLTRVMIFDKNGGTINYIIDEFQSNIPVEDSKFTFNEANYPGVEIIDMR